MSQGVVPPRFQEAHLDSLDEVPFRCVLDYATNIRKHLASGLGMCLSGPPGVGKTYALAALTNYYVSLHKKDTRPFAIFETVTDLLEKYAPIAQAKVVDYSRGCTWDETYENCRWLVLNDIGKEYRGGRYAEQAAYRLGRLLRRRAEQRLVTHLTTNLPITYVDGVPSFRDEYGDSLDSLLAEITDRYEVNGRDRRQEVR